MYGPVLNDYAFFSMDPNGLYALGKKLLPEWAEAVSPLVVKVKLNEADSVVLSEITGSSGSMSAANDLFAPKAHSAFWVKMSLHTLRLYPVPDFVVQDLPEWATAVSDHSPGQWYVDVDMTQATPVLLSTISGWPIGKAQSVIEEFSQVAAKEAAKKAKAVYTYGGVGVAGIKTHPQEGVVIQGGGGGVGVGGGASVVYNGSLEEYNALSKKYPWDSGKIAGLTELPYNSALPNPKDYLLAHLTGHSSTMEFDIKDIDPEAVNLLFGNNTLPTPAEVEEVDEVFTSSPVDVPHKPSKLPVMLSDKAKASLSPERQKISQRALETVQCGCIPFPGSDWQVSSDCPVHGGTEARTIAVVNAVLDYLGVIP